MFEICQDLPLAPKTQKHRWRLNETRQEQLNGYQFVKLIVSTGRKIHLSHSTLTQHPDELVACNPAARSYGSIHISISSVRNLPGGFAQRALDKVKIMIRRSEQGFDFAPQRHISAASLFEKSAALFRWQFDCLMEQRLDTFPRCGRQRVHGRPAPP
jgi:hypothetical protein